jgi:excisionase family DNA binding protein
MIHLQRKRDNVKLEDLPEVLKIDDVRRILRVGRDTVYDELNSGKLPGFRVGKQHRIYREAFLKYLETAGDQTKKDAR